MIIGVGMLFSVIMYGLVAYFLKVDFAIEKELLTNIYWVINFIVIIMMIIILAIRKTIYYSPRLIKEDFTLIQVLEKWRMIDIVLLAAAEIIPVFGLVVTFLGMPFNRTWHFFLASGFLMIMLMPMGIKVRGKLTILKEHIGRDEL
jgi:hypothetical protein